MTTEQKNFPKMVEGRSPIKHNLVLQNKLTSNWQEQIRQKPSEDVKKHKIFGLSKYKFSRGFKYKSASGTPSNKKISPQNVSGRKININKTLDSNRHYVQQQSRNYC